MKQEIIEEKFPEDILDQLKQGFEDIKEGKIKRVK